MIANIWKPEGMTSLRIETADIEELIFRCGWTVLDSVEGMTEADRAEVARIEARGFAEQRHPGLKWWHDRRVQCDRQKEVARMNKTFDSWSTAQRAM